MSETICFVAMMDTLFDVFNVNNYDSRRKKESHFRMLTDQLMIAV